MKRKLTLAGGLLSVFAGFAAIVSTIVSLVFLVIELGALMQDVASSGTPIGADTMAIAVASIVLHAVPLMFICVSTILSIVSTCAWKKEADKFKKFKPTIIATIVFIIIGAICSCIVGGIVGYLAGLIMFPAAVLLIVDVARERRRVDHANKEVPTVVASEEVTVEEPKE